MQSLSAIKLTEYILVKALLYTILFHTFIIITQRQLFCLSSSGPKLWNNLTKSLRIKNSIYVFSDNYKKVLIQFV